MGMGGNGPYLKWGGGGSKTGGDENSDHFTRAEPQKSQVLHLELFSPPLVPPFGGMKQHPHNLEQESTKGGEIPLAT